MNLAQRIAAAICLAAAVLFFLPPPAGMPPHAMHAAALLVLAIGLWATAALPEHLTGLLFLALCMLLAIAPASVVFSGFTSATLWLVLGGLVIAEAVRATGLGERLANALFARVKPICFKLALFGTVTGLFTTNPAQPAVLAPLAAQMAEAAGWRIEAVLMIIAVGFSTMLLPYQAPPVMVGVAVTGMRLRTMLRLTVPLTAVCLLVLLPLEYLWWWVLGYFR